MKQLKIVHRGKPKLFAVVLARLTRLDPEETDLLIQMGGAYLGKKRCKDPHAVVSEGDMVQAWFRLPLEMKPVDFQPSWVIEANDRFLVAAKPPGLPTQGRRDADYMAFYLLLEQNMGGYLGLHHRLDQDTSGLLLFSREKAINRDIAQIFSDGLVHKEYIAVCSGKWPFPADEAEIDLPLGPKIGSRGTIQQVTKKGKRALSVVKRLAEFDGLTLVQAIPKTGRTHQIRAHLAYHELPLWGDGWYGGPRTDFRFLLHCSRLAWPETGRLIKADYRLAVPQLWRQAPQALLDALPEDLRP